MGKTILIADSGSTKTDWVLSEDGQPARPLATQGINPVHQDEATIAAILRDELLPQTGVGGVDEIFFYGSGCLAALQPTMRRLLAEAFPTAAGIEAHSDLLGAARALCSRDEGIACILGTGANSCLFDGQAIVANTPPLGYILGDEGSGAVLGRLFLNRLLKGFLPSEMLNELLEEQRMSSVADIISRVYRQPMANRWLASLAMFIARQREKNADVRAIVVDNFRMFFRRNVTPYHRPDLPVSAVGSIAYYFRGELAEAAAAEGFTVGLVERAPIGRLLAYHRPSA